MSAAHGRGRQFRCVLGAIALLAVMRGGGADHRSAAAQAPASPPDRLAARIDPYVVKPRVLVLTDIANEPDDQMSMVRFLVYSNEFDVEGLVAVTSTWMRNRVRPDVIHTVIDAYAQVQPNLVAHDPRFPGARRR